MDIYSLFSVFGSFQQAAYTTSKVAFVLAMTFIAARIVSTLIDKHFRNISKKMEVSRTSSKLLKRLIHVSVYLLGIGVAIYTVPSLRQLSYALFASAGFIGIVIGFAAQQAFSNIISGIFIAVFVPFRVGDRIETNQQYGTVEDITLRHTVIKKPSNERVIVPNSKILDNDIINYSIIDEKSRFAIEIPISYSDNIDTAQEIIIDEAEKHDLTEHGESEVITKNLADSGVTLELRIWARDRGDAWQAGQDLRESIKKRFDEEDITIPFPQRTVSYLTDLQEDKQ